MGIVTIEMDLKDAAALLDARNRLDEIQGTILRGNGSASTDLTDTVNRLDGLYWRFDNYQWERANEIAEQLQGPRG
jgi:hypothetical protein